MSAPAARVSSEAAQKAETKAEAGAPSRLRHREKSSRAKRVPKELTPGPRGGRSSGTGSLGQLLPAEARGRAAADEARIGPGRRAVLLVPG